jgi:hypothetical protein
MKKSELAMVVLIAAGGMIVAYFVAHALFGSAANQNVSVPTIQTISSDFQQPDPTIFNANAINPTVGVSLNESSQ